MGWVSSALAPAVSELATNSLWKLNATAGTAIFSAPTPPLDEDDRCVRESDGALAGALTHFGAGDVSARRCEQSRKIGVRRGSLRGRSSRVAGRGSRHRALAG